MQIVMKLFENQLPRFSSYLVLRNSSNAHSKTMLLSGGMKQTKI